MRLLIAAQTGHVFVFDTEGVSAETGNAGLSCQRLHPTAAAGNEPPSMPVSVHNTCPCHCLNLYSQKAMSCVIFSCTGEASS